MEKYIEKLLDTINYPNGFYIECGANDGITQSYTYELEKRNWSGILVEPSEIIFNECVKNRSTNNRFFNCALVKDDNITEIKGDFDGNCMSSINGTRLNRKTLKTVKCRTLTSILDDVSPDTIDLFSLDVEGYELEVLKGLDFNKYKPTYILVEIYSKDYNNIVEFLQQNNYTLQFSTTNYNKIDNPLWDGTHNDYLFKNK